ncbi:hypothetical protein [Sinisalibacter aestuarii]|uniref:Transposase n=1 Tax=Sinisalibacter aestuarii TaxID=2949426 RepID=A0ABQ5LVY6_9RHOB|nr:hypothetical protein STA1M1_30110 [Sinisalibacter aestuarii]
MKRSRFSEHLFTNLCHARRLIGASRDDYTITAPHTSLGGRTLWEYHQPSKMDQTLNRTILKTRS